MKTRYQAVVELAEEHGIDMPICREIYDVLFNNKPPLDAVRDLMTRQQKDEVAI